MLVSEVPEACLQSPWLLEQMVVIRAFVMSDLFDYDKLLEALAKRMPADEAEEPMDVHI